MRPTAEALESRRLLSATHAGPNLRRAPAERYSLTHHGTASRQPVTRMDASAVPAPRYLASGSLTAYAGNPILPPGPLGSVDQDKTGPRVVLKFGPGDYRMWYEAVPGPNRASVGYATSTDGLTWVKHGTVLSPSAAWEGGTSGEVSPNSILIENNVFKLWYHSWDGTHRRIGYATSPDGINWTKYPSPVLDVGPAGSYDDRMVVEPRVFHVGSGYRMYYGGLSYANPDDYRLMMATSADGISWTKYPTPLFGPAHRSAGFGIIFDNGIWNMWYGYGDQDGLSYAYSLDGFAWTNGANNPVLRRPTSPAAYGYHGVGDSISVYRDGDSYRVMYTGVTYSPSRGIYPEAICLATVAAPVMPGDTNHDGTVDFADVLRLAQHYGSTPATPADGDFNGDGSVTFADLLILAQNYGSRNNPASTVASRLWARKWVTTRVTTD